MYIYFILNNYDAFIAIFIAFIMRTLRESALGESESEKRLLLVIIYIFNVYAYTR